MQTFCTVALDQRDKLAALKRGSSSVEVNKARDMVAITNRSSLHESYQRHVIERIG